jgi:2-aminoethylphosphonate-pyruvate transaminase
MPDAPQVLLTPGPVVTSSRVRAALLRGDLCHREPAFRALLTEVRALLVGALGVATSHQAVLLSGSGTAAVESAVVSTVRPGRSVLVVNNGVYGDRIARIARAYAIPVHEIAGPWTAPADPDRVRDALRRHPDVDAVCCVHHETTTGLLNPVAEIGAAVAPSDACYVVDAVSALGAEAPAAAALGADVLCGTANKALHGLPGVAFVLLSEAGRQRVAEVPPRGLYLSVATHLDLQQRGEVAFTPAIPAIYALHEAVLEFQEEGGFAGRAARYRQRSQVVREGLAGLGLHPLVAPPHRAVSLSAYPLPAGVGFGELHDELARRGFVIYAAQGPLAGRAFRIAVMGALRLSMLHEFVAAAAGTLATPGPAGR